MSSLLDAHRISRVQVTIVGLGLLILLIDGLDIQLLSFAAPVILQQWGISQAEFGIALSATLVGMAIGTVAGGTLGDRWGRRRTVVASVLLFSVATAGIALAGSVAPMALLRLLSGLGFGAAIPNVYVLVTELLPRRVRPRAVGLLAIGTPGGGMLGGLIALAVISSLGWPVLFVACGALGLLAVVAFRLLVPESPGHLFSRGDVEGARRSLGRVVGRPAHDPALDIDPDPQMAQRRGGSVRELLGAQNTRLNTGAWLGLFCSQFVMYAFLAWLPTIIRGVGLPLEVALRAGIVYNLFGVISSVLTGWTVTRYGSRITMLTGGVVGVVAVAAMPAAIAAAVAGAQGPLFTVLAVACIGNSVVTTSVYTIVTHSYDVKYRATGVGYALTAGRIAGIVVTLAGGIVLTLTGTNTTVFFGSLAVVLVVAGSAALVIERHRHVPAARAGSIGLDDAGDAPGPAGGARTDTTGPAATGPQPVRDPS